MATTTNPTTTPAPMTAAMAAVPLPAVPVPAVPAGPAVAAPGPARRQRDRRVSGRPPDLIVPLATLLGLAERPGDIHGFGLLDPALARDLATTAAASPRTEVCVTVTSPEGYAISHGCARPARTSASPARPRPPSRSPPGLT